MHFLLFGAFLQFLKFFSKFSTICQNVRHPCYKVLVVLCSIFGGKILGAQDQINFQLILSKMPLESWMFVFYFVCKNAHSMESRKILWWRLLFGEIFRNNLWELNFCEQKNFQINSRTKFWFLICCWIWEFLVF